VSAESEKPAWTDPARQQAFEVWLAAMARSFALQPETLRLASADASFRRYFRIDCDGQPDGAITRIIMDAPPAQENSEPFVRIARLMADAGLNVPQVLAWDEAQGFMLLSDVGTQTMLQAANLDDAAANLPQFQNAIGSLLKLQLASKPGVLPGYDDALLRRELQLFPDWYIARHRGVTLSDAQQQTLARMFDAIVAQNLAAPQVYVHRDFMPRNLMIPLRADEPRLAVLDFQDAVYGPVTYDIASLMRDAFASWDEEFVLDVTVRYWEQARKLGLMDFEDWHADFASFFRAVEWMGLQRHLKVAGIFARLTLRDGKPKYLADTPRFLGYIRHTASRYRELTPLLRLVDEIEGTEAATAWSFGRL
jgi:aminoglycoside/choline kinase family phosphotransferase